MAPKDFTLRAYEPEDAPALTDLLNQPRVVWGTMQRPFTSVAERRRRSEAFHPELQLVALAGDRIVGIISLTREANRRAHVGSVGMAVRDDFQGQGCGTALLSAVVDHADRWLTLTRLELTVWADNEPAVRLYERHGFEREGLGRAYAYRDGRFVDALFMARLKG
ncbi:GNAT family N-acetyltransferase [Frigidibacter sp. RF13]|uniref:GNAT family N-acetyltransferase n=1 Tax=Frigidibacter sp. RF13 TaxID=2997340 RepID=UPI00226D5090|nr:GNAT family N-acetyltransferase [Frigidibacter sp. RF13]MCY1127569.1 GNAT family N-acetyltransferase [Frigidibacter sp. RF13]